LPVLQLINTGANRWGAGHRNLGHYHCLGCRPDLCRTVDASRHAPATLCRI